MYRFQLELHGSKPFGTCFSYFLMVGAGQSTMYEYISIVENLDSECSKQGWLWAAGGCTDEIVYPFSNRTKKDFIFQNCAKHYTNLRREVLVMNFCVSAVSKAPSRLWGRLQLMQEDQLDVCSS